MLNEIFRKRYNNYASYIDFINKLSIVTSISFKFLSANITRNYKLYLDNKNKTTLSLVVDKLRDDITAQSAEFKVIADDIKTDCCTEFQKIIDDFLTKEKE